MLSEDTDQNPCQVLRQNLIVILNIMRYLYKLLFVPYFCQQNETSDAFWLF